MVGQLWPLAQIIDPGQLVRVDQGGWCYQSKSLPLCQWGDTMSDPRSRALSVYTGEAFEGGLIGVSHVCAAVEGVTRESVSKGLEMISALKLS